MKRSRVVNPRIGYTALNCLPVVDSKVQETCRKSDTVLQFAKRWLKQIKQQWHG